MKHHGSEKHWRFAAVLWLLWVPAAAAVAGEIPDTPSELATSMSPRVELRQGFVDPPDAAKPRVYWRWLNSRVTREAITRDLEEMKKKGIGGALLFDAGAPAGRMPWGPLFMKNGNRRDP